MYHAHAVCGVGIWSGQTEDGWLCLVAAGSLAGWGLGSSEGSFILTSGGGRWLLTAVSVSLRVLSSLGPVFGLPHGRVAGFQKSGKLGKERREGEM